MTRAGWKAWWTGWLFLDLRGRRLQDLLVACQRTGLVLYDVAWVDGRVRVRLPLLSYGAFLRLCRAYQVRFRVLGRGGFPVWRRRLWQRKAWLAGVGVFVAGVYALGSVIWQVDVSGVDDQDRQVILQAARESGLYVGAWRPALPDAAALQADILEKLPSLLWVGVEVKGSKAQLQAVEKVPAQSQVAAQPHHIAAGKPGVVRKVFAERGQALVKPGQVVHPGQVLISGALAGGAVQVPAAGRVWAEVWYTSRVEVPLQVRWNGLTGERSERDYLVIGPWAVHVWGWDPPFTAAFTQDQETDWQLAGHPLPVQWRRVMVYQAQTQDWQASLSDAQSRALQLALQDVQRHMQADGSLLGQSVLQWQVNHGKLYATVLTRTEEDIGVPVPIPPESAAAAPR